MLGSGKGMERFKLDEPRSDKDQDQLGDITLGTSRNSRVGLVPRFKWPHPPRKRGEYLHESLAGAQCPMPVATGMVSCRPVANPTISRVGGFALCPHSPRDGPHAPFSCMDSQMGCPWERYPNVNFA